MGVCRFVICLLFLISPAALCVTWAQNQDMTRLEREERQAMLSTIYEDIRKEYYDPKFHGLDWNAKFAEAKQNVAKANTKTEANLQIAAMLEALDDSHTHFIPPPRSVHEDYGFQYEMVGNRCFVMHVKPGSDAETKGLKRGDEVLTINGFIPTRDSLSKMKYVLNVLYPQTGVRLSVRDAAGSTHNLDVAAKEKETPAILTGVDRWRASLDLQENRLQGAPAWIEFGDSLMILRLSNFVFSDLNAEGLIEKARTHKALILDLRGNPGGSLETLKHFLAGFFENDVKIGDEVKRDKTTHSTTKTRHDPFTGKLFVLINSQSASAAEIFARVIQLEKRGIVIGDISSGSVMAAQFRSHMYGTHQVLVYGSELSVADFIMPDGKSLEHTGVTPDEKMLPSQEDLALNRDSVLSAAAAKAGVNLPPEKASTLFPVEWPRD
jgi:C-terminal processing protease CtpA/Prc